MVRRPITDLLDEARCYAYLRVWLYPDGRVCPHNHPLPSNQAPQDRHRAPILAYRCRCRGTVFNIFTGTVFSKTRYSYRIILQILRSLAQGLLPKHLTSELQRAATKHTRCGEPGSCVTCSPNLYNGNLPAKQIAN